MRILRDIVLADLLRQHEDPAVRRHAQIVVDVRQIFPEDIGILVILDQPIAPGRVADRHIERQQVAVGVEMGLLDIDMGVGLR